MNRNDDIELVLEQWFTEGPRHMSDRLFDGTLDQIERLPRGRLADLQSRLPAMHVNLRLAAAAAVLIAVAGVSLAVINRIPGAGAPVSPSPTAVRYVAQTFRPFGPGTGGTFSATMRLDVLGVEDTTQLQLVNPFGPSGSSWIFIVSGIRPGTEPASASCAAPFSASQRTPAALAAWLGTFASLEVSPPQPVTIGGLPGVVVDITERPDASKACGVEQADGQRIELLAGGSWLHPDTKLRLILLDRGDGESILIDIGSETTWASVDAAMSIVDGFEFTR